MCQVRYFRSLAEPLPVLHRETYCRPNHTVTYLGTRNLVRLRAFFRRLHVDPGDVCHPTARHLTPIGGEYPRIRREGLLRQTHPSSRTVGDMERGLSPPDSNGALLSTKCAARTPSRAHHHQWASLLSISRVCWASVGLTESRHQIRTSQECPCVPSIAAPPQPDRYRYRATKRTPKLRACNKTRRARRQSRRVVPLVRLGPILAGT